MSTEMLIECDLHELIGGHGAPDLIERTLARLEQTPEALLAPVHELAAARPRLLYSRIAAAACVLLALALIIWVMWPQPLPEGVTASTGAQYQVRDKHIELREGWLLLNGGAPEVKAAGANATLLTGRALIGTDVPDESGANELASELTLTETEKAMLTNPSKWLVFAGLALCIFQGEVLVNGEVVRAQEEPRVDRNDPVIREGEGFRVLREWSGADSKITARRVEFITDASAWASLWIEHKEIGGIPPKAPDVDFSKEMVLAVFAGSSVNSRGYYMHDMLEYGDTCTIRVDENTYQTMGGSDSVTPYGIFVLPATYFRVVVEENVQGLLNNPPQWKEIARHTPAVIIDTTVAWGRTFLRAGQGGPGGSELRVITNVEEWDAAIRDIGLMDGIWPLPDFSKSIGFLAFGTRLKGLNGDLELTTVGLNAERIVLRLTSPVAQSEGAPEYENIYGVWLFSGLDRDLMFESPLYSMNAPTRWQEGSSWRFAERQFGVNYIEYGNDGGAKDPVFGIAHNQEEFVKLCETMDIKKKRLWDWVNWETDNYIVVLPGEMRVSGGGTTTTTTENGVHTITYHLISTSGEAPGIHRPYMLIKVPKTSDTIVLKQSFSAGPAPATVTEVARFE